MYYVKFTGDLPGEGSAEKIWHSCTPYVIKKYVISGHNVMAKRWPGSSQRRYDPTHPCVSEGGVTGSLTASLCAIQQPRDEKRGGGSLFGGFESWVPKYSWKSNSLPFKTQHHSLCTCCREQSAMNKNRKIHWRMASLESQCIFVP